MIDQVDVCGVVQSSNVILCEIQSRWEVGYLVNAHTAEVAVKHLARKKLQRIAAVTVLKNRMAMIYGFCF